MLSPTVKTGLKSYAIGPKVRALRLKKKMGLTELGSHTGLSAALLSKIERGQIFPTLPTLLRVALVFGVGLDYFFMGSREKPVLGIVRKAERLRFRDKAAKRATYEFESLDFSATERRTSAYYAEFADADPRTLPLHQHDGGEFIYVLSGALALHAAGDEHRLDAGDSVYFDASVPHGYRRATARPCTAIVVTSP